MKTDRFCSLRLRIYIVDTWFIARTGNTDLAAGIALGAPIFIFDFGWALPGQRWDCFCPVFTENCESYYPRIRYFARRFLHIMHEIPTCEKA